MDKTSLYDSLLNVSLTLLKRSEYVVPGKDYIHNKLKIYENESKNEYHIIFFLMNQKKVLKSIKLASTTKEDRKEYILEIDLFLTRLYNSLKSELRRNDYVHICPECDKMHINQSMYFDRNYICDRCIQNVDPKKYKISGYVYFIESEVTKLIKIGFTSQHVNKRKKQIQGMHGGNLNILRYFPSNPRAEKYLHERFAHLNASGEWFSPGNELLDFIRHISDQDLNEELRVEGYV